MKTGYQKTLYSVVLAAVLTLASCVAMTTGKILTDIREHPENWAFIEGVPFYSQDTSMCGPAALASVIGYWGASAGMNDVAQKVYHERLRGTFPIDMVIYAKEQGFDASFYKGGISDLKEKIRAGIPLILFINKGSSLFPIGHYMVVTGYNEKMRMVVAHSATNENEPFTYDALLKAWSRTDYSTLLIKPPDKERR